MCDIFKDCRKTFNVQKTEVKLMSYSIATFIRKHFTRTKMAHAETHAENNMDSEVEITSSSRNKGKKSV